MKAGSVRGIVYKYGEGALGGVTRLWERWLDVIEPRLQPNTARKSSDSLIITTSAYLL